LIKEYWILWTQSEFIWRFCRLWRWKTSKKFYYIVHFNHTLKNAVEWHNNENHRNSSASITEGI